MTVPLESGMAKGKLRGPHDPAGFVHGSRRPADRAPGRGVGRWRRPPAFVQGTTLNDVRIDPPGVGAISIVIMIADSQVYNIFRAK